MAVIGFVAAPFVDRLFVVEFRSATTTSSKMLTTVVGAFADATRSLSRQFTGSFRERHVVNSSDRTGPAVQVDRIASDQALGMALTLLNIFFHRSTSALYPVRTLILVPIYPTKPSPR